MQDDEIKIISQMQDTYRNMKDEIGKVIIGQDDVIEKIIIAIFSKGHSILMGVPGLAKTLLVNTISEAMSLGFNRIQFTPDLMPSDITGTEILQEGENGSKRSFEFVKGPLFSNVVLADEINRTPPKTQAALLEAMQEHKVTVSGVRHELPSPFFVLATQNPIEQEGTYPLPEAQLDRFMFFIQVQYPSADEELLIAKRTTAIEDVRLNSVLSAESIMQFQKVIRKIPVPEHIYQYVTSIVRNTRPQLKDSPDWIEKFVAWGAGPRAVQYLILGARAHAALHGSYMVRIEDVKAIAREVLGHRIQLSFQAESEGATSIDVVERLMDETLIQS